MCLSSHFRNISTSIRATKWFVLVMLSCATASHPFLLVKTPSIRTLLTFMVGDWKKGNLFGSETRTRDEFQMHWLCFSATMIWTVVDRQKNTFLLYTLNTFYLHWSTITPSFWHNSSLAKLYKSCHLTRLYKCGNALLPATSSWYDWFLTGFSVSHA